MALKLPAGVPHARFLDNEQKIREVAQYRLPEDDFLCRWDVATADAQYSVLKYRRGELSVDDFLEAERADSLLKIGQMIAGACPSQSLIKPLVEER